MYVRPSVCILTYGVDIWSIVCVRHGAFTSSPLSANQIAPFISQVSQTNRSNLWITWITWITTFTAFDAVKLVNHVKDVNYFCPKLDLFFSVNHVNHVNHRDLPRSKLTAVALFLPFNWKLQIIDTAVNVYEFGW